MQPIIRDLQARAQAGDAEAAQQLQPWLDAYPQLKESQAAALDLSGRVEQAWIKVMAGQDLLAAQQLRREMAAMKAEMVSPNAPVLERVLAESLVISYFALKRAEYLVAQPVPDACVTQLRDRHLTAAQKRLHAAARALELYSGKKLAIERRTSKCPPPARSRTEPQTAHRSRRTSPRITG